MANSKQCVENQLNLLSTVNHNVKVCALNFNNNLNNTSLIVISCNYVKQVS